MSHHQPSTINHLASAFSGRKVFVTGHTGFKGSWLCEWLLLLGAKVTGLALEPNTEPSLFNQLKLAERMDSRIGDIRDLELVKRTILEVQPDYVFHLAAQPLVRLSYDIPVETYATNVMGTVHVLEALRVYDQHLRTHPSPATPDQTLTSSATEIHPSPATLHPPPSHLSATSATFPPAKHCIAVMITTDKCYENREWLHAYREEDPMGGYDPYSSSKGACELAIASYRRSYFNQQPATSNQQPATRHSSPAPRIALASARAGNVIGGGDWALDRIVPDCIRALQKGEKIPVRNKIATRPWQHVLEPLGGYLTLAAALATRHAPPPDQTLTSSATPATRPSPPDTLARSATFSPSHLSALGATLPPPAAPDQLCSAFNFGPTLSSNKTVADLVQEVLKHWPGEWLDRSDPNALHEASKLNLTIDKAFHLLNWQPKWDFAETIQKTIAWYKQVQSGSCPLQLTQQQIQEYMARR